MKALDPGYSYELARAVDKIPDGLTGTSHWAHGVLLDFVKMSLNGSTIINNGTTNEEVLKALIHRLNFQQSNLPCRENALAITKLEEALMWLEKRYQDRKDRGVDNTTNP